MTFPDRLKALLPGIATVAFLCCGCKGTPDWMFSSTSQLKDPAALHLPYAKLQEQAGNLEEAIKSYNMVLAEDPKSVDAMLGLARVDLMAGRIPEAEQGFLKALKTAPNNPHVLDSVGQFYVTQERWDEAVTMLNRAMLAGPGDQAIRYHLAVALARSGNVDAAMPHFAKTVGDAEANYNVGFILYEKGQLDAAEQQFLQAVIKKPELADAQHWLNEIRREKESRLLLSGGGQTGRGYEELAPPRTAAKPAVSPRPSRATQAAGVQSNSSNNSIVPTGHNPGSSPSTDRWPGRGVSQPLPSPAPPAASGLTPQQIEQMRNQHRR